MEETIFVGIPSYRDPECQHTISNLLAQASNPMRISIGVCFQYDFENDLDCFEKWPVSLFEDQIRVDRVDFKEATGPCWARFRTQMLWKGEMYYLSIDSHMRFIRDWDQILIDMLKKCPIEKAIITTYPPDYSLPNNLSTDSRCILTCCSKFGDDGMLRLVGKRVCKSFMDPIPSFFWVSGFSFSSAAVILEVPYDPHLPFLFFGEESSMIVRLWTAGWNFFAPNQNIIYHLWERVHRPSFRENKDPENIE